MKKIIVYGFGLLNIIIIGFFWLQNSFETLNFPEVADLQLALGRLSGLLLAACILLQFLIMSRAPFLEKTFGLDKLARVHRFVGKYLIILLISHPLFLTLAYAKFNNTGLLTQYFNFLRFEDVPAAIFAFWILIFVICYSIVMVWQKWEFEKWYRAHLLVYLAVALAFGHQLEIGNDFAASKTFTAYWYLLYTFTFACVLIYRFGLPIMHFYKHRFQVDSLAAETPNTTSIYITGRKMDSFKFTAGQFIIVRFLDKERCWQAHPFSLSQNYNGKFLRLSVKNSGDFTSQISNLSPKIPVLIEGPYGLFTHDKLKGLKALLIAGGIGITPLRGILEDLAKNGKEAILIYAVKTTEDIALRGELENLSDKYNIKIHYILSEQGDTNLIETHTKSQNITFSTGFIDGNAVKELVPDATEREVFLCGPPPMMKSLIKKLRELGIPKRHIYFERFSL